MSKRRRDTDRTSAFDGEGHLQDEEELNPKRLPLDSLRIKKESSSLTPIGSFAPHSSASPAYTPIIGSIHEAGFQAWKKSFKRQALNKDMEAPNPLQYSLKQTKEVPSPSPQENQPFALDDSDKYPSFDLWHQCALLNIKSTPCKHSGTCQEAFAQSTWSSPSHGRWRLVLENRHFIRCLDCAILMKIPRPGNIIDHVNSRRHRQQNAAVREGGEDARFDLLSEEQKHRQRLLESSLLELQMKERGLKKDTSIWSDSEDEDSDAGDKTGKFETNPKIKNGSGEPGLDDGVAGGESMELEYAEINVYRQLAEEQHRNEQLEKEMEGLRKLQSQKGGLLEMDYALTRKKERYRKLEKSSRIDRGLLRDMMQWFMRYRVAEAKIVETGIKKEIVNDESGLDKKNAGMADEKDNDNQLDLLVRWVTEKLDAQNKPPQKASNALIEEMDALASKIHEKCMTNSGQDDELMAMLCKWISANEKL